MKFTPALKIIYAGMKHPYEILYTLKLTTKNVNCKYLADAHKGSRQLKTSTELGKTHIKNSVYFSGRTANPLIPPP